MNQVSTQIVQNHVMPSDQLEQGSPRQTCTKSANPCQTKNHASTSGDDMRTS